MRISLGLPTANSPADGRIVLAWARAAEASGFAGVAVIDRLLAPTYDPLIALAGVAGATERVELLTSVLLAPLRPVTVLASQAATLDQLSGGRLTLGLGVGSRAADYGAAGIDFSTRGQVMRAQLAELRQVWNAPVDFATVGPAPFTPGGPPILMGGTSAITIRRVVEYGVGWICGRGGAAAFDELAQPIRDAWAAAGRAGRPRLVSVLNCAIGATAAADRQQFLGSYYGSAAFFESLLEETTTDIGQLQDALAQHEELGCEEVILLPCSADIEHVELFAKVL
jgi:alkanesulfonate monooxygenase SsuD/methylene tetrahydromethanopterin reductase-like flavin-dependent oxidoreductase (luciferase family)